MIVGALLGFIVSQLIQWRFFPQTPNLIKLLVLPRKK